ncbi:MAG: polyprenyl synthetase family protein [Desulfobacteraceae bacterium]|uniref:Polyprenyl synthetase family protein n=1 Tax=Candidatus Desulfacyla euxinica TaxID=2841693 RepID=A0A8J6MYP2_9DELT|nr:polyprenyl synthetase family protein [Candidatus Desulfacyla euxinica]MBL6978990.1 polyprenyl synthetase family protein [Desulfobacteraceae bacterium]
MERKMPDEAVPNLKIYLAEKKKTVEAALQGYFPEPEGLTSDLINAMRYSLFAGGKRLRPILCIAGAETVEGSGRQILPVACALELIHTYSLIHDDLPLMDDDDLRRGKPTNHKVFGEPIALLAGDGLLTEAFNLMTSVHISGKISPQILLRAISLISRAAGYDGMVGGQAVDIQWEGKKADFTVVKFMHIHKTGALITASVASGAILGGADESQIEAITSYGEKIGLAFQISDDILDIEGDSKTMGKKAGADEQKGKMTYPAVLGLNESKRIQSELVQTAVLDLREFGSRAEPLRQIARYIIKRKK